MKIDKRTGAVLSLVFGALILLKPDLLAFLVGLYLIIAGLVDLAK